MTDQNVPSAQDEQTEQEELEMAKAEIAQLTPEGYLELKRYIAALQDQQSLYEAGGIAFCELWGAHGGRINLTARGVSPIVALENLIRAVKYAERFNLKPTQQMAPAPAPAPVQKAPEPTVMFVAPQTQTAGSPQPVAQPQYVPLNAPDAQMYKVDHVVHDISRNQIHYMTVVTQPGTPYGSYGATAWPESFPKGFDINTFEYKKPTSPPENMAYAMIGKYTDKQGKERTKVFSFSATP
jgi:hypothetical protein